jgi:HEAT repeat protein
VGKDARAVEPLIEALQDEDAQVRDRAAEALQKITGKDFGKDADKWRQWQKEGKEKEQPAPAAKEKPAPAAKEF